MKSSTNRHWKRILLWAVLITVIYIVYTIYAEWRGLSRMHYVGYDYVFFYYAFQAVIHHGTSWVNLYNMKSEQMFLAHYHFPLQPYNQYVYPPQFAWLFSVYGLLPFYLSSALWMLTSAILYFCGVFWALRIVWPRIRRIHLLVAFLLAAVMTPFQVDIGVGNVNSILFSAVCLTFYLLYNQKKAALAGIPLGIAVLIKVTPVAILIVFLLRGQWKVCRWAAIVVAVSTIASSLFVGVSPIFNYALHFSSFGRTSMQNGPAPYNQSIVGVLGMFQQHHWIDGSSSIQFGIFILFVGFSLWAIYFALRRTHSADVRLDFALSSLTPLIFSPLIEEAHMVFVMPALLVFTRMAYEAYRKKTKRGLYASVIITWVTGISILLMSLPATFALNYLTSHFPHLFWIHIQMFVVLIAVFSITLWLYQQQLTSSSPIIRYRGQTKSPFRINRPS